MLNVFEKMNLTLIVYYLALFEALVLISSISPTYAFTVKGMVYDQDGVTPLTAKVDFTFTIFDSNRQCILYQEKQYNVNLATYHGEFKLSVGVPPGGSRRVKGVDPNLSFAKIFATNKAEILTASGMCPGYVPNAGYRYLQIQITRQPNGEAITLSPDLTLNPYTRAVIQAAAQGTSGTASSDAIASNLTTEPSPNPTASPLPKQYLENAGKVNPANLVRLTNGSEASVLHHHDSRYLRKGGPGTSNNLGSSGATTTSSVGIGTTTPPSDSQIFVTSASDSVIEAIQASPSQSADLFRFLDSGGTTLASVDANGKFYFGSTQTSRTEACTKGYVSGLILPSMLVPDSAINWGATPNVISANKIACSTPNAILKSGSSGEVTCSPLSGIDLPNLSWSKIIGKPTTLSGYGITDGLGLVSPYLSGTPFAPTAVANTNTTQIATTAFVLGQASSANPIMDGTAAVGTATTFSRANHVHPLDNTRAPSESPSFSGNANFPGIGVWNSAGKVGIGTTNPIAKLDLQGQMRIASYDAGTPNSNELTINWNNSNNQFTTGDCSGSTTYHFQNVMEGAIYYLTMNGTGGGTCTFTDGANTYKFPKTGAAVASGRKAVFSFLRTGSFVFVSWDQY